MQSPLSQLVRSCLHRASCVGLIGISALSSSCSREGDASAPQPKPPSLPATIGMGTDPSAASTTTASTTTVESSSAAATATPKATSARPSSKLNVLLISVDSMRHDMPWNGYGRDIAPVMTAFEKNAVSYTRHYAISSYTSMSLGGLLAGRYPSEVERSGYFFGQYPESVLLFPELLQKASVKTMSAQAHFYFDKKKAGFHQGFDVYEIVPGITKDNTTDKNVTSPQSLELAMQMLSDKTNTSGTFFAWFHFLDPHDIYMDHKEIEPFGKKVRDKYDGEVKFTDLHIGKLLDFVNQQEWGKNTAVIITSDHGEAFGEHKMYRHGFEIWEVLVHVPLMIQAPGITPRRIDALRSSIDIAPTVLDLTGLPPEPSFVGHSLVPELFGAEALQRDVIIDLPRTSDNDRRRALIHEQYKLIAEGDDHGYRLFDIVADPGETKDLVRDKDKKDVFEDMKARYKEASAKIKDVCPKMTEKLKGKRKNKPC